MFFFFFLIPIGIGVVSSLHKNIPHNQRFNCLAALLFLVILLNLVIVFLLNRTRIVILDFTDQMLSCSFLIFPYTKNRWSIASYGHRNFLFIFLAITLGQHSAYREDFVFKILNDVASHICLDVIRYSLKVALRC